MSIPARNYWLLKQEQCLKDNVLTMEFSLDGDTFAQDITTTDSIGEFLVK